MLTILLAALLAAPQQRSISFWTDAPGGSAQVWVMNEDGGARHRLTNPLLRQAR